MEKNVTSFSFARINIFCITAALVLGILYLIIQSGINRPDYKNVAGVLSLSIFILTVPEIIRSFIISEIKLPSDTYITLLLFLFLVLLGYLFKKTNFPFSIIFGFITVLVLGYYLSRIRLTPGHFVSSVFWGVITGTLFGIFTWGSDFISPFFLEKVIYLGKVSPDSLMHISIANIFNTYDIPSTGLDGIPAIKYHWGSHFIFSSLSTITGTGVFSFYNLGYPLIFIPLYLKSVFLLIGSIRQFRKFGQEINWFCFFLFILFHYRVFYDPQLGLPPLTPFNSEPYMTGMILLFFLTNIILSDFIYTGSLGKSSLIIISAGIFLVSFIKISLGFILFSSVIYVMIRYRLYRKLQFTIYTLILSFVFLISFMAFADSSGEKFNLLRPFQIVRWFAIYYNPYYLILITLLFLIVLFNQKDNLWSRIKERYYIDFEILLFIAIIGLIPGMIWDMSGNRHYFSDFQYWLSMILFLSYIPFILEKTKELLMSKRSYLVLKSFILIILVNIFIRTTNNAFRIYYSIQKDKREIAELKRNNTINKGEIQFFNELKKLADLPLKVKSESCIYFIKSDSLFSGIPDQNRFSTAFFIPSITGICAMEGNLTDPFRRDFTFSSYKNREAAKLTDVTNRARQKGFERIYEIRYDTINKIYGTKVSKL